MSRNTDGVRQNAAAGHAVDDFDRKLLGVLVEDATVSYAELGRRVGNPCESLLAVWAHDVANRGGHDGTPGGEPDLVIVNGRFTEDPLGGNP